MGILVINKYFKVEALGGIILLIAAMSGVLISNSPWRDYYHNVLNFQIPITIVSLDISKTVLFWINDGLVAVFFLLIGLEIKSELYSNKDSIKERLTLPLLTAIAGLIVPALIYTVFNYDNETNMRGWAIPTAMDTAFTLGILAVIGSKIPRSLKVFLMALSIIDDILAVLVIAIFYAEELSNISIIASATILGILIIINQSGVKNKWVYFSLGFLLWMFVLQSGVHASVAGVLFACTIPFDNKSENKNLVLSTKNFLHPLVSFVIMPIFALANTDIPLGAISFLQFIDPLSIGIILGLFLGKQLGVFTICSILIKNKIVKMPQGATWLQMYGISVLCGVGFTMSLFIGVLAFENGGPEYNCMVKSAVFAGSLMSAVLGYLVLNYSPKLSRNHKTLV